MITITELAKILSVSCKTLRLWEKEGKITSYRTPGGHRRYILEEIKSQLNYTTNDTTT